MAPLWSILNDHLENGDSKRPVTFFYGARTPRDLFYLDKLAAIHERFPNFHFVPGLSNLENGEQWDGEQGFIHTVVDRYFREKGLHTPKMEAYVCGPPPMIDALLPVLSRHGVAEDHTHIDRFTQSTSSR